MLAVLSAVLPDLAAPEPDWLALARTLETAEPGGQPPAGFTWHRQAALRPDDGPLQQHLDQARAFVALHPTWLLQLPLPGELAGLGRHQSGIALLTTAEFLRLLPHLFPDTAPPLWARSWPDPRRAAIDVDVLDPYHGRRSGYLIELFRGHHDAQQTADHTDLSCGGRGNDVV
ncbi:hypothetical protein [Actinoplanes sp. L3-i22]|uniref:hypothetical protein n=1 Tax=Actinoplanes sp. L3-i22 TaxID=2836373 RepID=UPI001C84416F|nr:hypothetical protein [Actinoplanes sp. L3-i22]